MPTPLSSASAYAGVADLTAYHDERHVRDMCGDADARETGDLSANAKVTKALLRASGEVEQAVLVGGRYTPEMLAALTGASLEALKGLVADLAYWHLSKRRYPQQKVSDCPGAEKAFEMLELLKAGERVFGLQEVHDATVLEPVDMSTDSTGNETRITDLANRYFGQRAER